MGIQGNTAQESDIYFTVMNALSNTRETQGNEPHSIVANQIIIN
jgi:hypothetical protein